MEVLPNLPHPNSCQQFVKCSVQNQALHKSAMCYIRVLDRNKGGVRDLEMTRQWKKNIKQVVLFIEYYKTVLTCRFAVYQCSLII